GGSASPCRGRSALRSFGVLKRSQSSFEASGHECPKLVVADTIAVARLLQASFRVSFPLVVADDAVLVGIKPFGLKRRDHVLRPDTGMQARAVALRCDRVV